MFFNAHQKKKHWIGFLCPGTTQEIGQDNDARLQYLKFALRSKNKKILFGPYIERYVYLLSLFTNYFTFQIILTSIFQFMH